jgi:hypothetical protein
MIAGMSIGPATVDADASATGSTLPDAARRAPMSRLVAARPGDGRDGQALRALLRHV